MKNLSPRSEIVIEEIPAPQRLAPFAYAVSADLTDPRLVDSDGEIEDIATGRFVLLHDPEVRKLGKGNSDASHLCARPLRQKWNLIHFFPMLVGRGLWMLFTIRAPNSWLLVGRSHES